MATIGKIAIGLTARTAEFTKGISRARRSLRQFGSSVGRMSRSVYGFGAGLAAVAAGGGMVLLVKNAFGAIDATAKLSDELGIATEELTGFQHAAGLSGTKNETLNKGIQRMVRILGDAAAGFSVGTKGLEQLGLTADEMVAKSPAEALKTVAEKIKAIENPTKRASAAYALFGRQGQELMNFLMMGREGLEDAAKEADRLGLSFSRLDAAQVEAANDAITRLRATFTGMFNQLAINLAPFVDDLATRFVNVGAQGETAGMRISNAFEGVGRIFANLADTLQFFVGTFHVIKAGLGAILASLTAAAYAFVRPLLALLKLIPGMGNKAREMEAGFKGAFQSFTEQTSESWGKANTAAQAFHDDAASTSFEKYLAGVRARSDAAAKAVAARAAGVGAGGATAAAGKLGLARTGDFRQVQLERIALLGTAGQQTAKQAQEIRSSQIEETNRILSRVERNLTGYAVAG